ncbi:hypothetical protein GCM10011583_10850 [Streptomyces camponoticapitis]|uniref:Uncharacterized protein n=1 Tax=Streptomyces camponoticapitis TaxID=1616125 RepID=A0ABQ2E0Z4_9ACTN|nr:hypothetical protein GCM10011583_10850 [Streptomyces camponoticapitis]
MTAIATTIAREERSRAWSRDITDSASHAVTEAASRPCGLRYAELTRARRRDETPGTHGVPGGREKAGTLPEAAGRDSSSTGW